MPLVMEVLVDPVPDTRATSAKTLGTLVERLGERTLPSLVSDLLEILQTNTAAVDIQGAAQGLAEVMAGLGVQRLEGLLPTIIQQTSSSTSHVREGFVTLLIYLPATFGNIFAPYIGKIIAPVLKGLADDSDYGVSPVLSDVIFANVSRQFAKLA